MAFIWDELSDRAGRIWDDAEGAVDRLFEGAVRVGVTGLRRSGKTVFVTALVDALLKGGRLPFLDAVSSGRFVAARLRPQPDPDVPRFAFERHLATLQGAEPAWPEPTRGIGQIRVALRYRPASAMRRIVSATSTLNLDIVDYPGEWLLDLPLLGQNYAEWSATTLELALEPPRDGLSTAWRNWCAETPRGAVADEEAARSGAALYTRYLLDCRDHPDGLSLLQPGRFVEPGDLRDAPLLTFCPLTPPANGARGNGTRDGLWSLMAERYEAYRTHVVRRFFAEHFSRLDRQIVLVDVLGALAGSAAGWRDTKRALELCMQAFRHGRGGWLDWLTGPRIDRVLFAATKADHLPTDQHARLTRLLSGLIGDTEAAIRFEGAAVDTVALASVRSTETVEVSHEGRSLRCVQGVPLGQDAAAVWHPGVVPEVPPQADWAEGAARFRAMSFRPPAGLGADARGMPHIRLDDALQLLIGDHLS